MSWVLLVLLYGVLKGGREIAKKKAMETNSVMEVLVAYTVLSFVMVIPQAKAAGGMEIKYFFLVAIKGFCMFLAWMCGFHSLKNIPVSLYGVLSLSRVLFATLLGVVVLHESMPPLQIAGLILVCTGLLLLKYNPFKKTDKATVTQTLVNTDEAKLSPFFIILAFVSCIMNSISGFMDKILMKDITSSQLQFWYMLFIVIYYLLYILIKREKLSWSVLKNKWVWLLALMFVIGDKALFIANGNPDSKITVMTLIKQSSCIVTILGGKLFFKEKGIAYKLFCASIVIAGILLGVLK